MKKSNHLTKHIFKLLIGFFSICLLLHSCKGKTGISHEDSLRAIAKTDSNQRVKADSIKVAKADSVKKDALAKLANTQDSIHMIAVMNLPIDNEHCDSVNKILQKDSIADPVIWNYYLLKEIQCKNKQWNTANPDRAVVTIAREENGKVLFNTIRVNTAEKIADAAKALITAAAIVKGENNPVITTVVSAAGSYAVDAYLDAAKRNDPLIIIYPSAILNKKIAKDGFTLTKDVYQQVSKINPAEPFILQVGAAKAIIVGAGAAAKLSAKGVGLTINASGKIVEVTGKVLGKTVSVIGDGAKGGLNLVKKTMPWNW